MLPDACAILLAIVSGSLPDSPSFAVKNAWLTGTIGTNPILPTKTEILRNSANRSRVPKEFLDRTATSLGAKDCSSTMLNAGMRVATWQEDRGQDGRPVSPDRQPAIEFYPIRLSKDGRFALVTWFDYWALEASDFHFAILRYNKKGWRIIRDGSFGPVA